MPVPANRTGSAYTDCCPAVRISRVSNVNVQRSGSAARLPRLGARTRRRGRSRGRSSHASAANAAAPVALATNSHPHPAYAARAPPARVATLSSTLIIQVSSVMHRLRWISSTAAVASMDWAAGRHISNTRPTAAAPAASATALRAIPAAVYAAQAAMFPATITFLGPTRSAAHPATGGPAAQPIPNAASTNATWLASRCRARAA